MLTAQEAADFLGISDQMTEEASELGLYDDPSPDYTAALKQARRRRANKAS